MIAHSQASGYLSFSLFSSSTLSSHAPDKPYWLEDEDIAIMEDLASPNHENKHVDTSAPMQNTLSS